MKRAVEFLLGGACVYVAMAAQAAGCADSGADGGLPSAQAGATGGGDAGFGGAPGNPSGGSGGVVARAGSSGSGGIFDPVPDADARGGTRLKVLTYQGSDGSELTFPALHDNERNESCTFRTAADGKTRCLPMRATLAPYFADAGCTIPAYFSAVPAGCATPPAYLSANAETCSPGGLTGERIFARGATPTSLYGGKPGACVAVYATIPAGSVAYGAGAEVPASAFVEATVAIHL